MSFFLPRLFLTPMLVNLEDMRIEVCDGSLCCNLALLRQTRAPIRTIQIKQTTDPTAKRVLVPLKCVIYDSGACKGVIHSRLHATSSVTDVLYIKRSELILFWPSPMTDSIPMTEANSDCVKQSNSFYRYDSLFYSLCCTFRIS